MSSNKRLYLSGAQKRKKHLETEATVKKLKPITSFFTPQHQEKKEKESDNGCEKSDFSSSDLQEKETEADVIVTPSNTDPDISIATDNLKEENMAATMLNTATLEQTDLLDKKHPTDKGHYKSVLTAELKRFIISHGPCQPKGPFPQNEETGTQFTSFFYESKNKAGLKIPRTW